MDTRALLNRKDEDETEGKMNVSEGGLHNRVKNVFEEVLGVSEIGEVCHPSSRF